MDFHTALKVALIEKYRTFSGRARRAEYWWFMVFASMCYITAVLLSALIHPAVGVLVVLAPLTPLMAVTTRRLHDLDCRGWWQILVYGVTGAAVFFTRPVALLAQFACLVPLFIVFSIRGSKGANRFGEDPLAQPAGPAATPDAES
ncbi:MAG: DUF805 domain-containing protein [Methylobacteriaceae bacterium]|jgi:uncharacterized membrane protein YhaH (DUF805 family)|nr:DUF805 domain-containing protein [Methylobacteriaceae bacterium]